MAADLSAGSDAVPTREDAAACVPRARAAHARRLDDPTAVLRTVGLRVTQPRLAVLDALAASPHADVDHITQVVRDAIGGVSVQAVYDVLRALVGAGLVRRIEPAGSPARFELRVGDNHHHVVCRNCGATADVDCAVGAAPCLAASDVSGFVVEEAEVIFWGACPACAGTMASG